MGTPLDVSFLDTDQTIIGSYLDVGILAYDGKNLHLLSGFRLNVEGRIVFTRNVVSNFLLLKIFRYLGVIL